MLKELLYKSIAREPLLRRWQRARLPGQTIVLTYHELAEDRRDIDAWTVVRKSDFIAQVDYLRRHFDVVSLDDAVARMGRDGNGEAPMAVITFDDGDAGNHEVLLPLVRSLNLPVTIFVSTQQVQEQRGYWFDRLINALQRKQRIDLDLKTHGLDGYIINRGRGRDNWKEIERLLADLKGLSPTDRARVCDDVLRRLETGTPEGFGQILPLSIAQVQELAACPLVTIGAHSHCHNILTQLPADDTRASVVRSKQLLESWTGKPVDYFAYPNGDYDDAVARIVREAGFKGALTTVPRPWRRTDSPYAIPRVSIGRFDTPERFRINLIGGVRQFLSWRRRPA